MIVTAALFIVIAGGASSYFRNASDGTSISGSQAHSAVSELARLDDYVRSIGAHESPAKGTPGKPLPDVNTMIERLADRLKTAPNDVDGWRMLGWSYFNTERYGEAAAAYAKALELDPGSADLRLAHEQAKANHAGKQDAGSSSRTGAVGERTDQPVTVKAAKSEVDAARGRDAAIRSMADDLEDRLRGLPRHSEGWVLLMRSRVALGEREVAASALRAALEVFKDDPAVSGKIASVAFDLGLRTD